MACFDDGGRGGNKIRAFVKRFVPIFFTYQLKLSYEVFNFRPVSPVPVKMDFVELGAERHREFKLGSKVELETKQGVKMYGVAKFLVDEGEHGNWAGVELEEEISGGTNGAFQVC